MHKKNCWEIKKCGREPGGDKVSEYGICPATISKELQGINSGHNAGRICWAVAGTFCDGEIQGIFAQKIDSCINCVVFKLVIEEEGGNFIMHLNEINTSQSK